MSDKFQGGALAGSVDVSLPVLLLTVADSVGKTGSVAADMTLSYWRQGGVRVAVSASNLAAVNSAHSDGGVKEVDAVNMPGQYRVDWPDAAFASGADWVTLTVLATDTFGSTQASVLTSNVVQGGDSFARIGAAGVGLTGVRLSATGVDDIHDEAVDGATTARESMRLSNAALGGKASGLATETAVYRDLADSKARITATVDADGNRTAVTRDLA